MLRASTVPALAKHATILSLAEFWNLNDNWETSGLVIRMQITERTDIDYCKASPSQFL
jgi:hypothetical protein